jgi:hypothetical protein
VERNNSGALRPLVGTSGVLLDFAKRLQLIRLIISKTVRFRGGGNVLGLYLVFHFPQQFLFETLSLP